MQRACDPDGLKRYVGGKQRLAAGAWKVAEALHASAQPLANRVPTMSTSRAISRIAVPAADGDLERCQPLKTYPVSNDKRTLIGAGVPQPRQGDRLAAARQ